MNVEIPLADPNSTCRMEIFKSRQSFEQYFDGAARLRVVTFCDSPEFILEVFDELAHLETLEVVVGDLTDYRERLVGKPGVADRLEQLLRTGRLTIYLTENKEVHAKLYLIEYGDGRACVINGSPNLSKHAWTRQTNMGDVYHTTTDTELFADCIAIYEELRSYNKSGPFLEDLSERIDASDRPREEVVELYTEGPNAEPDELAEVHGKLTERIEAEVPAVEMPVTPDEEPTGAMPTDLDVGDRITLSLRPYDDSTIAALSRMEDFDATLSNRRLSTTPDAFQRYARDVFHVPTMGVVPAERELRFHADGAVYDLAQSLPEPSDVDAALGGVETYFQTVDRYGNTTTPEGVKANMYEALLWFFWAPFVNQHARFFREEGVGDLDKALPYLYIYGESSAGKGTFVKFVLNLLSGGRVRGPADADEIDVRRVRNLRSAGTSFPVVIDDIPKDKVNKLNPLRNYFDGHWTGEYRFPMLAFVSNDDRPASWVRTRSKILQFDVSFSTSQVGRAEANALITHPNPLFQWFAGQFIDMQFTLGRDDDALREVRETMLSLYEYDERPVPPYFPHAPAELTHDPGRDRWQSLLRRHDVSITNGDEKLTISFPESMAYDTHSLKRDPPSTVRAERYGSDIIVKTPEAFVEWIGELPSDQPRGVLGRVRGAIGR